MKNLLTHFSKIRGYFSASQGNDVGYDCRLTVVRPSFDCRSTVLKLCSVLVFVLMVGVGNAWGGELVISLPSSSNVFSLSTSSTNDASSETTKSYGGYSYKLKAADKCYYYNSKALFIGKTNSYITFPAVANKKLSKVTIWNCSGAGSPKIAIYPTNSTTAVSGGSATTVSAGYSTTWTLSSTSVNTSYRMYITTSANLQMEGLRLVYINNAAYTVTFNAYDGSCGTSSLTEGSANAGVTLPTASPSSACAAEGWEFAGWAKSKCAETEVAPRLFLAGETYYPDGTETLHAVYRKLKDGSSTSTATFTASTLSGLTTLSSSPFTSSWWIHTASGVEFYLNYYGIYSNTFDIDDTDGEDYGWATLYGHRKIKQVVLTSSSSSYLLGNVTPNAGTATLTTSSATNTITCSGNVTSIDLFPNTTNNETMISAFTITYYDTYFNSQPSCCTQLGTINGSISLTQGGTSVTISGWDDVSNASKYTAKIYAADDLSSAVQTIENIATGSKSATFTGLTLNSDYVFSVTAIGNGSTYCDGDETFVDEINEIDVSSTPFKLSYSIYMDNGSGSGWTDHLLEDDGTYTATLGAGISYYQFGIRRGFDHGGWWAATLADNVYDTGDEEWTLNGSNNVRLQTFVGGSYIFTVDLSGANPKITITYPPANQAAGKIVYWDASIHGNNWTKLIFRVGTNASSNAGADCKTDGQLVPGTDNFYKVTTAEYNNMRAWAIANNAGWTGTQTNGVYRTNDFDDYNVTKSTQYQDYVVGNDGVTLIPSSSGTIGDKSYNNNCYFYPVTKTDGMLTHNVAVGAKPTGGSITVTYTNTSGTSGQTVTDGNNADLAHRCILNVVATPETGYNLATFTKNASAFAGGNYILTEDVAFAATFSLKQTTVNLNNHGATTAGAASVTATYSQAVPSIAANLPARTGYIFGGYWTGEDGTGTKYINADGTSANNWSIVDATTTLHAQWTPKRCTVTLTAGTGSNGSAVFDYDATTYVSFSPAVRVGWTCTGYWTNTGGTGTKILNADGTRADNVAGWWVSDKWSVDNTSATLYAGWTNTYGGDEFELVLDLSELSAGKKIIILDKDYAYGLSTTQNTNNRASVAASADGGFTMSGDKNVATLKAATSVQVITLEATGTANQYYLNVENGYLYANGTSTNNYNYLKTRANNATNAEQGQFLFSLNNGDFTIQAQSGNTFNTYLREYSTSTFSCYSTASSNKAVLVYVKRESCDDPANALSVNASPTAISTATGFNTSTLSTTGGNGGTVYYRVISSNKANATIDGTTFSATTAGTYTVQAYQLKNENICRQISTVDITVTTPILTTSKSSHPFEKTATGNSRNTNTIAISGANLVGDVSVALSGANADQFSISTTSVTAASAMASAQAITVTYSPTTAGAHTATITFSSTGTADKVVTITGTAADYYTVTWHISGSSNQTSQVESGTKPTFPSDPASCDDESTTFIGWTQTPWSGKLAQSAIDAKTADNVKVYKAASELPNVSGAIDYYAVWAKRSGSESSFDITASDIGSSYNSSESTITKIATNDIGYLHLMQNGNNSPTGWNSAQIIQFRGSSQCGRIYNKVAINGLSKLRIVAHSNAANLTIYYGTTSRSTSNTVSTPFASATGTQSVTYTINSSSSTNTTNLNYYDINIPSGNEYFYIYDGSSAAYIYKITVYYTSYTYSNYLTTCCETTNLTFGTIADPVTEYNILREDLSSASEAVSIDCDFESLNTSTEITWYSTSRAARTFVTPTGATTSTSSQLAEMTIDIANKKLTATSVGVYTITIHQDEATISATKYCERTASVTVNVTVRDKFVDMLNGEDVGVGGNGVITRDDTGGGIYTPTESDFDTDDLCKTTKRKLIGWIKAGDLKTSYGDANRVDEIDNLKTATPATNKIIAPNTQVQATGTTWYAVWADID